MGKKHPLQISGICALISDSASDYRSAMKYTSAIIVTQTSLQAPPPLAEVTSREFKDPGLPFWELDIKHKDIQKQPHS
jgi:hypothetical protein